VLAFKEQNCKLSLAEGLQIYLNYLKENGKTIGTDNGNSKFKVWESHDCTHVIFGNGVTFEEETLNDIHNILLCSYEWKDYLAYFDDPWLKKHMKYLIKEVGFFKLLKSFFYIARSVISVIKLRFKMKKKWPLKVPASYLERRICDLREEYGIEILNEKQRPKKFINWVGQIKNPQ
tara:strand:+ start:18743 stop:19270 length:528 start_codon:yes stop_codon:yes gene_type:complete